jgi:very-short-patch-repair endonuclease
MRRAGRLSGHMDLKRDPADRRVAEIAKKQHGVVSISQLRGAGVSETAVRGRVRNGRLHRLHRGVYAVGHAGVNHEGRWMAAVLAYGERAVLSHGSAAAHWGLLRHIDGPVDVSVPVRSRRRRRKGIRLHRCASLELEEGFDSRLVTRHEGIPITTPARTIADLRGIVPPHLVRRATRQAEILGLPLGGIATDGTRSDLERDFLRLCRRHALPFPEVNVGVGRWTVDFLWRHERLAVETDSYRWHRGAVAFEDDHARDLDLRRHGYSVRRFTEHQVRERPAQVAADLAEALSRAP